MTEIYGADLEMDLGNAAVVIPRDAASADSVFVTPEDFGAKGDGVTNDTAAVRQAMQNDAVYLRGTYKVTSDITSTALIVQGDGDAKILYSGGGACLTFTNDVHLADFCVETPDQTDGIAIRAQKNIVAERLNITGGRVGISVTRMYADCRISNCVFRNFWGDSARAIDIHWGRIVCVEFNTVENVRNALPRDADGIAVRQDNHSRDDSVLLPPAIIRGNYIHNCRGRGMKLQTFAADCCYNLIANDEDFPVIHYFSAIDVQWGDSVVRGNIIRAPAGINVTLRSYMPNTEHVIEDNDYAYVAGTPTPDFDEVTRETYYKAIGVTDSTNGEPTINRICIQRNKITGKPGNKADIRLAAADNLTYYIADNEVKGGKTVAPVQFIKQPTSLTRYCFERNIFHDGDYFADYRFTAFPNIKGDDTILVRTAFDFDDVLPDVAFVAMRPIGSSFNGYAMLRTVGRHDDYMIELTDGLVRKVFQTDGTLVEYQSESREAILELIPTLFTSVQIISQPVDATVNVNRTAYFRVDAVGPAPMTYQWQYSVNGTQWNNSTLTGYNTPTLTVVGSSFRDGQMYRCIITDANSNSVTSDAATLTINSPSAITITAQPENAIAQIGDVVEFHVEATGKDLTYQWQTCAADSDTWSDSSATGYDTDTLQITVGAGVDGQKFRCVLTDSDSNTATTDVVTLTITEDTEEE